MGILNISGMYALIKYTDLGVYAVVLTTMVLNCVHFIDTPLYASYSEYKNDNILSGDYFTFSKHGSTVFMDKFNKLLLAQCI